MRTDIKLGRFQTKRKNVVLEDLLTKVGNLPVRGRVRVWITPREN